MRLGPSWGNLEEELFFDCVHCGLCLPACPTYLELGTEMDSPRGRLYLLKSLAEGTLEATPEVLRHVDLCLVCRACETACPSGVRFARVMEGGRSYLFGSRTRSIGRRLLRRAITAIFPYPTRLAFLLAPLRWVRIPRWLRKVFPLFALLPPGPRAEGLPPELPAWGQERARVALFLGCVQRVLFAGTNAAAARVLSRAGCRVTIPGGQGCCGALALHAGDREGARRFARALIDAFGRSDELVAATAAGCGATMKEYGHLLEDDPAYAEKARRFAARVRDVTEILDLLSPEPPPLPRPLRVTYHDACHLAHAQNVREAPRRLVRTMGGAELVELEEADLCCGSAGSYNLTERSMARRLQARKVDRILETGADCVLAANPGCILQIRAGLALRGERVPVLHPVELLDLAYRGVSP
ncbi:MAG: glycolate oxidase iron-sulfur subunit [Candidatus Binatia bacterium]|nr:MAG: glycolate oxidase iron-sulfur subunit [Candidatus Binatia bacterium]